MSLPARDPHLSDPRCHTGLPLSPRCLVWLMAVMKQQPCLQSIRPHTGSRQPVIHVEQSIFQFIFILMSMRAAVTWNGLLYISFRSIVYTITKKGFSEERWGSMMRYEVPNILRSRRTNASQMCSAKRHSGKQKRFDQWHHRNGPDRHGHPSEGTGHRVIMWFSAGLLCLS